MSTRLLTAIITTVIWEILLAVAVLIGLPYTGYSLPLWGLALLMILLAVYCIWTYRAGTRALDRKPARGLTSMVGSRGRVVRKLNPSGQVRIAGEIWEARAEHDSIATGETVEVVAQSGLRLTVKRVELL